MEKFLLISPEIGKDKGGIQNWMYHVHKLLNTKKYILNTYSYKDKISTIFQNYNNNIFLLATWKMAIFLLPILFLKKKKIFIFIHGNEILNINFTLTYLLKYLVNRESTYFIANSHSIAELFYLETKRKIDFVQFPFMQIPSKQENLIKEPNLFFTITRLVKRKNIKNIIYAFEKLKKEKFTFKYNIAGIGEEMQSLQNLVEQLDLTEEIKLLGKVDENKKDELYQNSSYFLLPSLFDKSDGSIEGYGIVFIEANAYGIPVLSGDTGGMIEAVIDTKTGLHSDGSIDDIYNKIKKLITYHFDTNYIYKHARKHDYLAQEEFLNFVESKINGK